MNTPVTGLHHVTAITGDLQQNVDFYGGLLGLRLVKKTVNFDDPTAYHLYYGDGTGTPGTVVTFFHWSGLEAEGRAGAGQATAIVFSVPDGSLEPWAGRLGRHGVSVQRRERFGEEALLFRDPDGLPLEIVASARDRRSGWASAWVCEKHALRGLHAVELTVADSAPVEALLTGAMGFRLVRREGARARFEVGAGGPGSYVDVIGDLAQRPGLPGAGTVHHVAWSVPDDAAQLFMQGTLQGAGYRTSPVRDRSYFRSIYYRAPGGLLFEVATETPGFAIDEPVDSLGATLRLPPQYEAQREQIEQLLPELRSPRSYV